MGAGGSVRRSPSTLRNEIETLRERELNREEELEKQRGAEETKTEAYISQLQSEKYELAEQLREARASLKVQIEGWKKEQNKTLALMFNDLPLSLLSGTSPDFTTTDASLSKHFPMVTITQCDTVGFASLTTRLQPQTVIKLVDHLHAIIDEAFCDRNIFVMERTSDGCIAVGGLVEFTTDDLIGGRETGGTISPLSMTDSSYGSELDLDHHHTKQDPALPTTEPPSHYASLLATASLKLMSFSTRVAVPGAGNKQLQLRIALHCGPCSAGIVGLQTSTGATRIPHYKLFGPTVKHTNSLCTTGLALQIRVSKQCRDLLLKAGGFQFERCPDYMMSASRKPIESYWLVGKEGLSVKLPSLEQAVSLSEYDDTIEI